jgi:hypothetical protein
VWLVGQFGLVDNCTGTVALDLKSPDVLGTLVDSMYLILLAWACLALLGIAWTTSTKTTCCSSFDKLPHYIMYFMFQSCNANLAP